jgi:hypothetical protein
LRINETVMLDIRDWRPDLGEFGKLHVRHGKGSRGRGPKPRLVPATNGADLLMDWWLAEVRHLFGDDWSDPDAAILPSERHDPDLGRCRREGADALRQGLFQATARWLPAWWAAFAISSVSPSGPPCATPLPRATPASNTKPTHFRPTS